MFLVLLASLVAVGVVGAQDYTHTTNYASGYLGANIADHSSKAVGVRNILNEGKEKYMIVPCSTPRKQFTVQLSREVHVDLVALSNREYFSSSVKNFTLLGSLAYPCSPPSCYWRVLGNFQANFSKGVQVFPVESQAPVRYVRFLWVSRHGRERSCTMTSFQVYGTDLLENLAAELAADGPKKDRPFDASQFNRLPDSQQATSGQLRPESHLKHHSDTPEYDPLEFRRQTTNSTPLRLRGAALYFTQGRGAQCQVWREPAKVHRQEPSLGSAGFTPVVALLRQVRELAEALDNVVSAHRHTKLRLTEMERARASAELLCSKAVQESATTLEGQWASERRALIAEFSAKLDSKVDAQHVASHNCALMTVLSVTSLVVGVISLMCSVLRPRLGTSRQTQRVHVRADPTDLHIEPPVTSPTDRLSGSVDALDRLLE